MEIDELGRIIVWPHVTEHVYWEDVELALRRHCECAQESPGARVEDPYGGTRHTFASSIHADRQGKRFMIHTAREEGEIQTHVSGLWELT